MILSLDHVAIGVPNLEEGIAWWLGETGVRPAIGGPHHGLGTRNAVASLGGSLYLELISVDPEQEATSPARTWLEALDQPRPFGWCYACDDSTQTHGDLASAGVEAAHFPVSRTTPDGKEIVWRLVFPAHTLGPVIPYLIDWGEAPSPGLDAPVGCTLIDARPRHPDPKPVQELLGRMKLEMVVEAGPRSGPVFRFASPRGELVVEP